MVVVAIVKAMSKEGGMMVGPASLPRAGPAGSMAAGNGWTGAAAMQWQFP